MKDIGKKNKIQENTIENKLGIDCLLLASIFRWWYSSNLQTQTFQGIYK